MKQNLKEFIMGFFIIVIPFSIAIGLLVFAGCSYKPDHRNYPQTQSGNIICDPNK